MELSRTKIVFLALTAVFVVVICIAVPIAIANSEGGGASNGTANGNDTANGNSTDTGCIVGCTRHRKLKQVPSLHIFIIRVENFLI